MALSYAYCCQNILSSKRIVVKTGLHLIEVDASNNDEWSLLEIGFVVLALKLGLTISHALH